MNIKIKFLTLLGIVALIAACSKESFTTDNVNVQSRVTSTRNGLTDFTSVNALENLQGGDLDIALESIEESLNSTYSYTDQSLGVIGSSEMEFTIPVTGSNITTEQSENIYETALNLWVTSYQNFEGVNKQAVLLDIERLPNSNLNEATIKVIALVGESEENMPVSPCDKVSFKKNATFNLKDATPVLPYTPNMFNASKEMARKLNTKINNDPCVYFTDPKKLTITYPSNETHVKSTGSFVTAEEMEKAYCDLLAKLQLIQVPARYSIASVVVTSDVALCNCGGRFVITVYIGKKKTKVPCNPNGPEGLPPPSH